LTGALHQSRQHPFQLHLKAAIEYSSFIGYGAKWDYINRHTQWAHDSLRRLPFLEPMRN